ncbi:hypothetical protein EH165_12300 [Nakamurella antarctica]|uniref:Lipoprotein LpqN n=1 Tax=Nakamurella antarctica TaxID=1902245 RepID=A0A3G8ZNH0_9ACTN|nr:hypothetical protein [Nakamurella antarctica]AZI58800.1 hypothetical protein EH165_12300 [Nakamurella antarctica]
MTVRNRIFRTGMALLIGVGVLTACSSGAAAPATASASSKPPQSPASSLAPGIPGSAGVTPGAAPATESNPVGDIPDTQAFVEYTPAQGGYTVKVPEGWARTDTPTQNGGASTLFSDKYNSIRIDTTAAAAAPTVQSGESELTSISSAATGFTPGKVTLEQRKAGPAVLITYQADSAANAVTGKVVAQDIQRYEFFSSGKTVALTLSAPLGSDNVDPWRTVTDSFRFSR